jgi:transposase
MNIHNNARLTYARRLEMVRGIIEQRLTRAKAAVQAGVSEPTARKWLGRYLAEGKAGLKDHSSRPKRSPRAIEPDTALTIGELRRRRLTQARIARTINVSKSTVGRVLRRARLSRLRNLEPWEPVVRYEHEHPENESVRTYGPLTDEGFDHDPHIILGSKVPAHKPLPDIHRIAALLKRWLLGTHHGAVDPRHVDYYLDEFTFRFNRRTSRSRGMLFYRLIQQSAIAAPVTYANIRDNQHHAQPSRALVALWS